MAATPLKGPNAGWINNALESAIEKYGPPKHIISDQAHVFTGTVFAELLGKYHIKPRLGAIGKHGSIAVTERVNKTLKYEWLKRVALIKGIDHLTELCNEFELWYNSWRPHMTLDGNRPDDVFLRQQAWQARTWCQNGAMQYWTTLLQTDTGNRLQTKKSCVALLFGLSNHGPNTGKVCKYLTY